MIYARAMGMVENPSLAEIARKVGKKLKKVSVPYAFR